MSHGNPSFRLCNSVAKAARLAGKWALLCTSIAFCPALFAGAPAASGKPEVIAYVFPQNAVLKSSDIDARRLTRINYAFSNLLGGRIVKGFPTDAQNLAALNALKRDNPTLTVLVSVGGWLWSGNFSDMALTAASRHLFIESAVEFINRYDLDGLDIDWEYPGMAGSTNHFRPVDKQDYTSLLRELRRRFDQEERTSHHHLLLSIAAGASSEFLEHTEMRSAQQYVDTVNLMAYDYYEPDSDPVTGNHAPLFTDPADPKSISADHSIREFEQAGVPAAKIVLGVPFYGHTWGQVAGRNHGLFQPGKPVPDILSTYGSIAANMLNGGYTRYWDESASAPYLYNPAKRIFVSYEDPESLALKCSYVLSHGLGGVMFWDYSSDPSGTLLKTIDRSLHMNPASRAASQ